MDFEKRVLVDAFDDMKKDNMTCAFSDKQAFDKCSVKSIEARQEGNKLFTRKSHDRKTHEKIWKLYTTSIAFAPTESEELATGFANRSAFLLHLKKYKDTLSDVERALKITQSSVLKVKLFCRQTECFVALQEGKQSSSLGKAKYWLNKVEDNNEKLKLNKMIEKAQQVLEEDNVSDNPEKERTNDLVCKNDAVTMNYDKKFGRGLVATRDIKPGEWVYIEKFYVASVNKSKTHAYCSHCLGISWALIPCDHCAYYMYCSEKCKTKAWQKYPDIECRMKYISLAEHFVSYFIELGIRSLIIAIKETGSIEQLRKLVNEVDNSKDMKTKGFSKDGKVLSNNFESLCSLKACRCSRKIQGTTFAAVKALQSLAKSTDIFGKNFQCNAEKLKNDEDVIFIGCLLLRLIYTSNLNAFSVQSMSEDCKVTENFFNCLQSLCCARGMSISLETSLINHSCDNNVDKFYTNDGRVVYYATKPIKKNSQIFSSYYLDYTYDKKSRQGMLLCLFEFTCNCVACKQDWPTPEFICKNDTPILYACPAKYNRTIIEIMHKNNDIMTCLSEGSRRKFSQEEIQSLAKDIAKIHAEKTQKPNMATAAFHAGFRYMMEKYYFDVLKIPSACSKGN